METFTFEPFIEGNEMKKLEPNILISIFNDVETSAIKSYDNYYNFRLIETKTIDGIEVNGTYYPFMKKFIILYIYVLLRDNGVKGFYLKVEKTKTF